MSAKRIDISPADCPRGWREAPVSSVAEVLFSNVDKKTEPGELPVRLCNYIDVYNNDYITADMEFMRATATHSEIARFAVNVGDVILTKDSETPDDIGVPAVVDSTARDIVCGYHLAMLRPNQDRVDPTFLAKQLADWPLARYFGRQANGSTRYGLSTTAIQGATLRLPPLDQQTQIGRIIRMLDAAIAKTEAVISKLRSIRAGMLHDLLTRGLDSNGQLRDPLRHPEQFTLSPLGPIPKEWEIDSLVSRISLPEGQVDPRIEPYRDWILIAPDHIASGTGRLLARQTAHEQGAISGKYTFLANDVLYSKIRPYLCKAVLAEEHGLCSADMYPLRPLEGVAPRFLLAVVLSHAFTRFASAVSMRSGFPKINRTELAEYRLAWPPSEEQAQIAELIKASDSEEMATERERAKHLQLKTGLMSDLLSGRVKTVDDESSKGPP